MAFEDLAYLKDQVLSRLPLEQLYTESLSRLLNESISLNSANTEGWHRRVRCPFHSDANPSLSVNSVTGGFRCHACEATGSFFDFWMKYRECDFTEAFKELAIKASVDIKEWRTSNKHKELVEKYHQIDAESPQGNIDPSKFSNKADAHDKRNRKIHPKIVNAFVEAITPEHIIYLNSKRGLTLPTIKKYQIGWNENAKVKTADGSWRYGRYTLPVYNKSGECRNIRMYSPDGDPAFKMINYKEVKDGNEVGYGTPARLFGLYSLYTKTINHVCFCEGEFDAILLNQEFEKAKLTDWLAVTGTHGVNTFEKEWLSFLKDKHIYFLYDCDSPGRAKAPAICTQYFLPLIKSSYIKEAKDVILPLAGTKEDKDITDFFVKHGRKLEELIALIQSTSPLQPGGINTDEATVKPIYVSCFGTAIKDARYIDKRISVPLTVSGQTSRIYHAVRSYCVEECPREECCNDKLEKIIPYGHDLFIQSSHLSKMKLNCILRDLACTQNQKCQIKVNKKVVMEEHYAHKVVERWERTIRLRPFDSSKKDLKQSESEEEKQDANDASIDEDSRDQIPIPIFILQPEIPIRIRPRNYLATGYIRSNPLNSEVSFFVEKLDPLDKDWEKFELNEESIRNLQVFSEMNPISIVEDLSNNITRIYDSPHILLTILLAYCSPLQFSFNNEVIRGWINACIIGDSGTGKSSSYQKISEYLQLGDLFSTLSGGRTGLLYAIKQTKESWHVRVGRYVGADGMIIAIDEAQSMSKEELRQMAIAMDTGYLDISRVATGGYDTRTRTIFIMNPANQRTVSDFSYGCQALASCFDPTFIRRLDIAVFCVSKEQHDHYNILQEQKENCRISAEALKSLIYWAWNRKVDDIHWTTEATKQCLEEATKLSGVYGYSDLIPLVHPGDIRHNLARLSVAYAILGGSFTDDMHGVIVKLEHVLAVSDFLDLVYTSSGCNLKTYSYIEEQKKTLVNYNEIRHNFNIILKSAASVSDKKSNSDTMFCKFISVCRERKKIQLYDTREHLACSADTARHCVNILLAYHLLEIIEGGYKITRKFNLFMQRWCDEDVTFNSAQGEVTKKVSLILDELRQGIDKNTIDTLRSAPAYSNHNGDEEFRKPRNQSSFRDSEAAFSSDESVQDYDFFDGSEF